MRSLRLARAGAARLPVRRQALSGRLRALMIAGALVAVLAAACSSGADSPEAVAPAASAAPAPETPQPAQDDYLEIFTKAVDTVGSTARLLSGVAIRLSQDPESAPQSEALVRSAISTFSFVAGSLAEAEPPPDRVELHNRLVEAIDRYSEAATFLLPDAESARADYWSFQPRFQSGGALMHEVGAVLEGRGPGS